MSALPLGGHIRKSDTPGIGEYNPDGGDIANKLKSSGSLSKDGMSMFMGSSRSRASASASATGVHIGPGSYDLEHGSIKEKMSASTNPRLPGFGSSSVRSGPDDD